MPSNGATTCPVTFDASGSGCLSLTLLPQAESKSNTRTSEAEPNNFRLNKPFTHVENGKWAHRRCVRPGCPILASSICFDKCRSTGRRFLTQDICGTH